MQYGDKIRELRRKANLTQSQLAKRLGVSTGAVGLWEVNRREPDSNILLKLSKEFNVSVDYLLDNEERNTITIIGRNGTYSRFQLSEDKLQAISNLVESLESQDK